MSDGRRPAERLVTVVLAPFRRWAWAEAAYCLLGFPVAVAGFVLVVVPLALGTALAVSLVGAVLGLLLVVASTGVARAFAGVHRSLAARLLDEHVPAPSAFRPGRGMFGRLDARLRDAAAWRAVGYVLAKLPAAALGMYAVGWWLTALVDLTAPLRWWLIEPTMLGGRTVITPLPWGSPKADSFADTLGVAAMGVVIVLMAPWFTRGVVAVDRWLLRALLGAGPLTERVRALEETRAMAVDDSTSLLRRLERDLHDGAQVRLVALAMSLDMAREKMRDHDPVLDVQGVRRLLDTAHAQAVEALSDLRNLSRGLHTPALDDGLAAALATLAAGSTVPVDLAVDVPRRPTAAIETISYFCVAELLTNVIKHSGARHATVTVTETEEDDGLLRLRVLDDGCGGAHLGAGSGLPGLAQRVRAVDGTFDVTSPAGGPTAVTVTLPLHA
jgi:signal transduction histidine kinase